MTTYSFNLDLEEQEFWAIKEAIDFYLTDEAIDLRKKQPHLVKYAADVRLKKLLATGKLYEKIETISTNNFREISENDFFKSKNQVSFQPTLFDLVFEQLRSDPQLLESARSPSLEMFLNDPLLSQLVLNALLDLLEKSQEFVKNECQNLLLSNDGREFFCRVLGAQLFKELQREIDSLG